MSDALPLGPALVREYQHPLPPERLLALLDGPRRVYFGGPLEADGLGGRVWLSCDPVSSLRASGNRLELRGRDGRRRTLEGPVFELLERELARYAGLPRGPLGLGPGAFGALGFEAGCNALGLPVAGGDALFPDVSLGIYLSLVEHRGACYRVFDLEGGRLCRRVEAALERSEREPWPEPVEAAPCRARSSLRRDAYLRAVETVLHHVGEGDVYQVNLAQRFDGPLGQAPLELFGRLCRRFPAPLMAYLDWADDGSLLSDSPELFLSRQGSRIETRPIKGTRPRACEPRRDAELALELMESEKDAAELTMIVDLERNDLGRVAEIGSVRVVERRRLVSLPTVHHQVAQVEARLRCGVGLAELLRATFPGGSITGAPKESALRLITRLEPVRRELYTGAVGHLGFDGDLLLNVAIRTLLVRGGHWWLHAGGGIVAQSEPQAEYQETLDKARAFFELLGVEPPGI